MSAKATSSAISAYWMLWPVDPLSEGSPKSTLSPEQRLDAGQCQDSESRGHEDAEHERQRVLQRPLGRHEDDRRHDLRAGHHRDGEREDIGVHRPAEPTPIPAPPPHPDGMRAGGATGCGSTRSRPTPSRPSAAATRHQARGNWATRPSSSASASGPWPSGSTSTSRSPGCSEQPGVRREAVSADRLGRRRRASSSWTAARALEVADADPRRPGEAQVQAVEARAVVEVAADQTQSMLHQSRTPHEWSRWPGARRSASVSPSIAIVPLTRHGIS